jgi:predicted ATP-grasp superfamily ATP-dependent carboligase
VDSRYLLLKIAHEEGILTPATSLINNLGDLEPWRLAQPFPWVLKADGTAAGNGVRIAHTLGEARGYFSGLRQSIGSLRTIKRLTLDRDLILEKQWWDAWARVRPAIVAQSFIRGNAANCAVVCWKGEVLAGVGCEVISTESPLGPATVVQLVDNADMMLAARRIVRRLSLSGFVGLDFMIEESTGLTYLIEMNARCTPLSHLRLGFGRDMIGVLSAQLTGKRLVDSVSITQKNLIAYFPQAWLRNSKWLSSSFHDIPKAEPELVHDLCRPLSDRTLTNKLGNYLRFVLKHFGQFKSQDPPQSD